jgi:spoIIIJ-associated protein
MVEKARRSASHVRQTGEPVQLEPMNPYQRRIVHLAIVDEPGVKSFSTGEGFLRRLTIAPSKKST